MFAAFCVFFKLFVTNVCSCRFYTLFLAFVNRSFNTMQFKFIASDWYHAAFFFFWLLSPSTLKKMSVYFLVWNYFLFFLNSSHAVLAHLPIMRNEIVSKTVFVNILVYLLLRRTWRLEALLILIDLTYMKWIEWLHLWVTC
jgi:hypothetical protein